MTMMTMRMRMAKGAFFLVKFVCVWFLIKTFQVGIFVGSFPLTNFFVAFLLLYFFVGKTTEYIYVPEGHFALTRHINGSYELLPRGHHVRFLSTFRTIDNGENSVWSTRSLRGIDVTNVSMMMTTSKRDFDTQDFSTVSVDFHFTLGLASHITKKIRDTTYYLFLREEINNIAFIVTGAQDADLSHLIRRSILSELHSLAQKTANAIPLRKTKRKPEKPLMADNPSPSLSSPLSSSECILPCANDVLCFSGAIIDSANNALLSAGVEITDFKITLSQFQRNSSPSLCPPKEREDGMEPSGSM